MGSISIQERYDDIVRISGLSEPIVRRVLKASRESLVESLKKGNKATLPGICSITPEIRNKLSIDINDSTYIKLKARASSAMENQFKSMGGFEKTDEDICKEMYEKLNLVEDGEILIHTYNREGEDVKARQIEALT